VDNLDVILDKFMFRYYKRGHKVIYNAETNCHPDISLAPKFPCQDKKYKYLNAGAFIGEREYIIEVLNRCEKLMKKKTDFGYSEQGFIQRVFLENIKKNDLSIWIDHDCHIFQVLWDQNGGRSANFDIVYNENKIYNIHTNTKPSIFHYPGPTGHGNTVWKIINKEFK
jgi:hypothetical protein